MMFISRCYRQFKSEEKGITSIEYGLIAVALAVFVVAVLYGENSLVLAIKAKFGLLNTTVTSAVLTSK